MKLSTGEFVVEKKLVLLGSSTVGKTSILNRLMRESFATVLSTTVGAAFKSKTIPVGNFQVKLLIWDTGGQERFRSLAPMYFHDAAAAIIVYDITSQQSFQEVEYWVRTLSENGPANILVALAGNKSDLKNRVISKTNGENFAERFGIPIFMETSALNGENINEIFNEIAKYITDAPHKDLKRPSFVKEKEKSCCF